jgi:two-component system, OmpR family, phosphate regulon sensor histidine kinase PhoR
MKNAHLRTIIIFGTVLLAGLLVVQIYWFKKAFDVAEKQFDHSVQVALKKVADSVASDAEITKLSSNFFVATTESALDEKAIDTLLRKEFLLRSLNIDYELGVYYADDDTIVYGNYVEASRKKLLDDHLTILSAESREKNFAIYFPTKKSYLAGELNIWIFSTLVLVLMSVLFAYAIASLLRERRFSELKNDFINNMTHEFKTPVTNIGIAGEILKKKSPDENKVYVDILLKENEKLRMKIDQVLLGASIDRVRKPVFETLDVHKLLSDCAEPFQLRLQERSGKLSLDFGASDAMIIGDRELLVQAITNVIDNAEKYSRHYPIITVKTKDQPAGIEIDIVDEGIGIPRGMLTKVFDKFFRVPSGDVHNVKGFGLGLNFVKNVIRSHQGEVRLFSELNKGTAVKIYLPKL